MMELLLAVLLVLGSFTGGVNSQVDVYKVVSVSNNAHTIYVQDAKGNVFEYYQAEQSQLCVNDQVIDIDGLLLQCEDNNSYDVEIGEYKVIDVNCNTYLITHDFVITLNEYE